MHTTLKKCLTAVSWWKTLELYNLSIQLLLTRVAYHLCKQLGNNTATLAHLALLAVWQVRNDSNDPTSG